MKNESTTECILRERPWRLQKTKYRARYMLLENLFSAFSKPRTDSSAARGLVEGVVLTAQQSLPGVNFWGDTRKARDAREIVVAFLTDVGSEDQIGYPDDSTKVEPDRDVRRTARMTLAKHVLPKIAAFNTANHAYNPENLGTLTTLIQFYGAREPWYHDPLDAHYGYARSLTDKLLKNVQDGLVNVYRELRRHLKDGCGCSDHGSHTADEQIRDLNQMLAKLHWWNVLSSARATSAIPQIYATACAFAHPSFSGIKLRFDWASVENLRAAHSFEQRQFVKQHCDDMMHDTCAIQLVSGGGGQPVENTDRHYGFRTLLLDLVASFVQEIELASPGILIDDAPLPEKPICIEHDECMNRAIQVGRAERAQAERLKTAENLHGAVEVLAKRDADD